jgi:hypothetical protein
MVEVPCKSCYTTGVKAQGKSSAEGKPPAPNEEEANESTGTAASPPARKPGAAKEVPAFRWKLVGYSHGIPLTLLKCVERNDIEAQLERYQAEGYYSELTIHPIEAKIPIPKELKDWISDREAAAAKSAGKAAAARKESAAKAKAARKPAAAKKPVRPSKVTASKKKAKAPSKAAVKKTDKAKAKKATAPKTKTKTKTKAKAKAKPKTRSTSKKKATTGKKKTAKKRKTKKKSR